MQDRRVLFHFDYVSPYAYIAWTQIHRIADEHGLAVEPVPTLFAGLLDAHGQRGPAEIPAKRVYLFKDAARKAHMLGLPPLIPPPTHPFNPLLALRVSSLDLPADTRRRLIDALYAATWSTGRGVESPAHVRAVLDTLGLDPELVERAAAPEVKDRLRRQTDEAIAAGVFGVPTMRVDGELFWGVDALPALEQFLAGNDSVDPEHLARWNALPRSAERVRSRPGNS